MKNTFDLRKFLIENKTPLINEFQGSSRIGTLKPMSARELSLRIEELEKSGLHIEDRPTLDIDEFTKTYRQFTIRLNGPYDNNGAFTIYDYNLGFDPNDIDHSNDEVTFHVGGAGRSSINSAKAELGNLFIPDARYIFKEEEEDFNADDAQKEDERTLPGGFGPQGRPLPMGTPDVFEEEEDREDMNDPTELEKLIQKAEERRKEMEDASKAVKKK